MDNCFFIFSKLELEPCDGDDETAGELGLFVREVDLVGDMSFLIESIVDRSSRK
jgi:hypothetical protein